MRSLFRFDNMCVRVMDFGDRVAEWWGTHSVEGRPSFRLGKKIKKCLRMTLGCGIR